MHVNGDDGDKNRCCGTPGDKKEMQQWRRTSEFSWQCKITHTNFDIHELSVCMVFSPINRRNIIGNSFPNFKLDGSNLNYVAKFKYLGHIIDNRLCGGLDIEREIKKNYSSELMYYWEDLTNAANWLNWDCLDHTVCVFTTLLCGVILLLVLGLASCDTI